MQPLSHSWQRQILPRPPWRWRVPALRLLPLTFELLQPALWLLPLTYELRQPALRLLPLTFKLLQGHRMQDIAVPSQQHLIGKPWSIDCSPLLPIRQQQWQRFRRGVRLSPRRLLRCPQTHRRLQLLRRQRVRLSSSDLRKLPPCALLQHL